MNFIIHSHKFMMVLGDKQQKTKNLSLFIPLRTETESQPIKNHCLDCEISTQKL